MLTREGTYNGQCVDIGPDTSSKGTPFIDIVFNVQLIASNGSWNDLDQPIDRHVRIYLSAAAWDQSITKLASLSFNGDFKNPKITDDWVALECTHDEYLGKPTEKWELADWGGSSERKAPDDNTLHTLNARYKTAITANKKPTTKPPTSKRSPVPDDEPPIPDIDESEIPSADDVPF